MDSMLHIGTCNRQSMKKNTRNKFDNKKEDFSDYPPNEGDPIYEESEDIYSKNKKQKLQKEGTSPMDNNLDIPGAELDDQDELIGEEDEENNYYSLEDQDGAEESQDDVDPKLEDD